MPCTGTCTDLHSQGSQQGSGVWRRISHVWRTGHSDKIEILALGINLLAMPTQ